MPTQPTPKSFAKSKTLWGIVLMTLPTLFQMFGLDFWSTEDTEALAAVGEHVFEALAGTFAIYGRFAAEHPIV